MKNILDFNMNKRKNIAKEVFERLFINPKKYYIITPVMIPNLKIERYLPQKDEYYLCSFSKEQVNKYYKSYQNKIALNPEFQYITLGHGGFVYKGAIISDSFLSDSNNKEKWYMFKKLPKGTLFQILEFNSYLDYVWFDSVFPNGGGASISGNFIVYDSDGNKFEVYEEFEKINKGVSGELPFNVIVNGGETKSKGRSEHGDAHFELKELNTNNVIAKIYMPTSENWNKANDKEKNKLLDSYWGKNLNKKERLKFVEWLSKNENENLIKCHNFWNQNNEHNNRTNKIE